MQLSRAFSLVREVAHMYVHAELVEVEVLEHVNGNDSYCQMTRPKVKPINDRGEPAVSYK